MLIIKRNGTTEEYQIEKIVNAAKKAFDSCSDITYSQETLLNIAKDVEKIIINQSNTTVEQIQDLVEESLMKNGYFQVAKSYILYRTNRSQKRKYKDSIISNFTSKEDLEDVLSKIEKDFTADAYSFEFLSQKFHSFIKEGQADSDLLISLIKAAVELVTKDAPDWEFIAARLLMLQFNRKLNLRKVKFETLFDKITYLSEKATHSTIEWAKY